MVLLGKVFCVLLMSLIIYWTNPVGVVYVEFILAGAGYVLVF